MLFLFPFSLACHAVRLFRLVVLICSLRGCRCLPARGSFPAVENASAVIHNRYILGRHSHMVGTAVRRMPLPCAAVLMFSSRRLSLTPPPRFAKYQKPMACRDVNWIFFAIIQRRPDILPRLGFCRPSDSSAFYSILAAHARNLLAYAVSSARL